MAGAMRKMAVYLGLVEDDEHYDEYDDYDEDSPERRHHDDGGRGGREERRGDQRGGAAVAHMTDRRPSSTISAVASGPDSRRITTLHPRNYNEARTIGENYREGVPVIMNLSDMDDGDAKRLVDFSAGLVFGLHGSIERVTAKVFLLSPAHVEVAAEDKARIAEGGFFNQS